MKYLIIYLEVEHLLNFLSQTEKGDLLDVLIKYAKDEIEPTIENKNVLNVFNFLRARLDEQFSKAKLKAETARANGATGGRPKNPKKPKGNPPKPTGLLSDFEEFWNLYDYKKARPKALDAFKKSLTKDTFENILAGVNAYISSRGTDKQYWKHPTTWLNAEAWKDEYVISAKTEKDICQELNKLVGKDWFREIETNDTQATFTISKENYELLKALDQSLKDQITNKIKTELQVLTIRPKYL